VREIGSEEGFGNVMQAGKRDVPRPVAQSAERAFHRGVAEHSIQSFANGRENHAGASRFQARGGSAFADLSENLRGGIAGNYGDGNDATAGGFHFLTSDNLIAGPVSTFDEHVRKQAGDDFARGRFIENNHSVDRFQSGENFGAFAFRQDGAACAFQLADARIAIEADDEHVAKRACLFENADMPGMEQIEAAVGEDDAAAAAFLAAKPQNRFVESQNLRVQRNSMKAHECGNNNRQNRSQMVSLGDGSLMPGSISTEGVPGFAASLPDAQPIAVKSISDGWYRVIPDSRPAATPRG